MFSDLVKKNIVPLVCIITMLFFLNIYFKNKFDKFKNNNSEDSDNVGNLKQPASKKILRYFGSDHCPHSNKNSTMYKLVNEDFRNFIKQNNLNCDIEINWSTPETQDKFKLANAQYVPTLTNNSYTHVDFKLAKEEYDKYTGVDLDNAAFLNMYNKL